MTDQEIETEPDGDFDPNQFNWRTLNEGDDVQGFLRWMLVNLLVGDPTGDADDSRRLNRDLASRVEDATRGFTDVRLTIQVSGVDVDVRHFLWSLQANLVREARREATRQLAAAADAEELFTIASTIQTALRRRAERVAANLGLELRTEEDW